MIKKFRDACDRLVALTEKNGHRLVGYHSADLPIFSALPLEAQAVSLTRVETMVSVCEMTIAAGKSVLDTPAIIEAFLRFENFTSAPDLLTHLQSDDSVDVWSATTHSLIFGNLVAFHLVSCSLEELYCQPWTELLTRDIYGVQEMFVEAVGAILSQKTPAIHSIAHIPDHVCRELGHEKRSIIQFPRFFAPVLQNGQTVAYLCVNKHFPYQESPRDY